MKIDIGTRIINNAAESRMRLAKARQAMEELREHEREMFLAELLEVEEAKVIQSSRPDWLGSDYPPNVTATPTGPFGIPRIPDSPGTRHAVELTSFGVARSSMCVCGHTAHNHDGSGLVCGVCTCPSFRVFADSPEKVKAASHINRVTTTKRKPSKKKR